MSVVYFVEAVGRDLIKIGIAQDYAKRISQLRVGSPDRLTLLGVIEAAEPRELERQFHQQFKASRVRGEWFTASPELRSLIADRASPAAEPEEGRGRRRTRHEFIRPWECTHERAGAIEDAIWDGAVLYDCPDCLAMHQLRSEDAHGLATRDVLIATHPEPGYRVRVGMYPPCLELLRNRRPPEKWFQATTELKEAGRKLRERVTGRTPHCGLTAPLLAAFADPSGGGAMTRQPPPAPPNLARRRAIALEALRQLERDAAAHERRILAHAEQVRAMRDGAEVAP